MIEISRAINGWRKNKFFLTISQLKKTTFYLFRIQVHNFPKMGTSFCTHNQFAINNSHIIDTKLTNI